MLHVNYRSVNIGASHSKGLECEPVPSHCTSWHVGTDITAIEVGDSRKDCDNPINTISAHCAHSPPLLLLASSSDPHHSECGIERKSFGAHIPTVQ